MAPELVQPPSFTFSEATNVAPESTEDLRASTKEGLATVKNELDEEIDFIHKTLREQITDLSRQIQFGFEQQASCWRRGWCIC